MNIKFTLPLHEQSATLEVAGGKGASLTRMANAGLPVPGGFHVTTEAYLQFVKENQLQSQINGAINSLNDSQPEKLEAVSRAILQMFTRARIPMEVANAIIQAYDSLPGNNPRVAVRSSATAEDLPEASFAGQQETFLNIHGADAVLNATRKCWASLWTARAISYRTRKQIPHDDVALAVVVQLLIDADVSGIMFTVNPLNGNRSQMLVNASWGLGEAVVGGLVTPDTLTIDKTTSKVINRETAKKLIQTVRAEGGTKEEPVPENLRMVPVLSDEKTAELALLGNKIETLYKMPMDIEWALKNGHFAIVQARPITTLSDPEPLAAIEWKLPPGTYAAMRNNIVELMTDPLTPLFKTFGLQAVNTSMNRVMARFLGGSGILPEAPIIAVNEYAYYNGSVKFGPMFKLILDTRGIIKRMLTGAVERWTEDCRPKYLEVIKYWEAKNVRELPTMEILEACRQLAEAAIEAYMALVSGVIPAAWMSEAWFSWTYNIGKRRGDPKPYTFLLGFDSSPIRSEKALYDISQWTQKHVELARFLQETPADKLLTLINQSQAPQGIKDNEWRAWLDKFNLYLREFGHMIYNLDFGNPVPADDPAPIIETFKLYLGGEGTNPHVRQQSLEGQRRDAIQSVQSRLKGRRLKSFQKNLSRAQKYAPLREDGLADVGLSYPLLRRFFREIGRRFSQSGIIKETDNVFWLVKEEVEDAARQLDRGEIIDNLAHLIPQRKAIWRSARKVAPPMALPQLKVFGRDLLELKSGGTKNGKDITLMGVSASPGSITAPACVVHGPEDFSKMKTGDVLVASLTTPAWTPLFARASAVVTDIGGPLSHGSIVAREYGIPAVLGTGDATARITDGQLITVSGDDGKVYFGKPKIMMRER